MAVSMSAVCMVFKSMFSPTLGIVNAILGTQLGWLESRSTALYTIIILTVWMGIGFDFLLFLSALRGIPTHVKDRENQERKQIFQTRKGIRMIVTVRMLNCFADTAQSGTLLLFIRFLFPGYFHAGKILIRFKLLVSQGRRGHHTCSIGK